MAAAERAAAHADVIHTATQQAGPPTSRGAESELATEIRDGSERPPFVEDLPSRSVPAPIASGEATVIGQGVGTPATPGGAMSADSGAAAPSGGHTSGGGPAVQLPATTLASHA